MYRVSLNTLTTLTLCLSIILSIYSNTPQLFTLAVIVYSLTLVYLAFKFGEDSQLIMVFSVILLCTCLRVYPYTYSIPLGVDPIRDVIYAYRVLEEGKLVYSMQRFVKYYQYFPATQIIPAINAIISGIEITQSHYLTLSTILSLGVIPLITALRSITGISGTRIFIAGLLYSVIPTITTWGYWVIPMSLSILLSAYSIMLFVKYIKSFKLLPITLSLLFSILAVMVHAVVGIVLLGFYITILITYYLDLKGGSFKSGGMLKFITVYNIVLATYTVLYLNLTGYLDVLLNYISRVPLNAIQSLGKILKFELAIEATSVMIPPTIPRVVELEYYPEVLKCTPKLYPVFYILPRWIWSIIVTLAPIILLLTCRLIRVKVGAFLKSTSIYSTLLMFFTAISLYLGLIWRVERYIASPATVYVILSISALVILIVKYRASSKVKYIVVLLIAVLTVTSILDPRVSFYTNPVEGDRVTFSASERSAALYLIVMRSPVPIISDYNLMTMYLYYLATLRNVTNVNIVFSPIHNYLDGGWNRNWILLLRRYSIESYYIWSLNFKKKPQIIVKVFYHTNLIYNNGNTFIFRSISVK